MYVVVQGEGEKKVNLGIHKARPRGLKGFLNDQAKNIVSF